MKKFFQRLEGIVIESGWLVFCAVAVVGGMADMDELTKAHKENYSALLPLLSLARSISVSLSSSFLMLR